MKDIKNGMIAGFWITLILVIMSAVMTSCAKTVYVPTESVRTEYRDKYHRDSVHVFDSIYIREKGDTVYLTRWRTEYKDRIKTDSIIVRDSIQVPYPVETPLTKWERVKMDAGGVALGCLGAVLIGTVWWVSRRVRRKVIR